MNRSEIEFKTAAWLNTFIGKEGYTLLKTEYIKEDGTYYLRIYLDLTEKERAERKEQMDKSIEEADKELLDKEKEISDEQEFPDEEIPAEPGIGINDCAKVSRRLSKWLDKEDFIPEEYILEVCSKGYLKDNE